jgi:hypothetical protein
MNKLKIAVLGLALGSAMSMAEECVIPEKPTLPDGASSSMEQMLEGQKSVKAFQAVNLEYMGCLEPQLAAAAAKIKEGDEAALKEHQQLQESYNAAVSREEEVAGQFNTEIREYKAANPG